MAEGEALALDSRWRKVCSETLTLVSRNKDAWIFKDPVIESKELTHEAKVAYSSAIPNPMDFTTIRKNLSAFESPAEFEADMLLVFRNCYLFNRPGQDAYEMGRDVENVFLAKWELERRKEIATSLYQQSIELAKSIGSDILVSSKRKAKRSPPAYDALNRKVIYEPVSASSSSSETSASNSWRELVTELFSSVKNNPSMVWFLKPVHKYPEIPQQVVQLYYNIIKTPMDLETIEKNLNLYPSPSEFRKDMELIVTNSVRFNPQGSPINTAALDLQAEITKAFLNPILLTAANTLPRDWKKVKKIMPELPPSSLVPPPVPAQTVVRLKRGGQPTPLAEEEELGSVKKLQKPEPPKTAPISSVLNVYRPMRPAPVDPSSWTQLASHVLEELSNLKDDNGTRLAWIFQRPIFKYDLPANIKRLYLLSITDLMDMSIIENKLRSDLHYTPKNFETDVELMIDNCLVFNDETQYPHKVAFVIKKHFVEYWISNGLRERAQALSSKQVGDAQIVLTTEAPNWNEIRQQAMPPPENVKDSDSVNANYPLNDELLYEWRVSQRYVMHQRRKKMIYN